MEGSLDTLESEVVDWEGARSAAFAFGHILYYRGGTLYALPFDAAARRASGAPVRTVSADLAEQPAFFPSPFTESTNGVLVFHSVASGLVWLDADGRGTRTSGEHHIRWLDIPVHDTVRMSDVQASGHLTRDADRVCHRERPP